MTQSRDRQPRSVGRLERLPGLHAVLSNNDFVIRRQHLLQERSKEVERRSELYQVC